MSRVELFYCMMLKLGGLLFQCALIAIVICGILYVINNLKAGKEKSNVIYLSEYKKALPNKAEHEQIIL